MASRDLHNNIKTVTSLAPATRTADANGTGIDTQGFESCEVVVSLGASGDTLSASVKLDLELEHSDDNSTWSDCAAVDTIGEASAGNFGTVDAADEDETTYRVGYIGNKRYVRPVLNFTGTHTNGIPCSAMGVLGHPASAPASGE